MMLHFGFGFTRRDTLRCNLGQFPDDANLATWVLSNMLVAATGAALGAQTAE
jgi:hypothetical protein